jgi:hypothetical protein
LPSGRNVAALCLFFLLIPLLPILRVYGTTATILVDPPVSSVTIGDTFNINIDVTDIADFTCWQLKLYFLRSVLNCTAAVEGPFLKTGGGTFYDKTITNNFNATHGQLLAYSTLLGDTSVTGSGAILTVTFKAVGIGNTPLHMADINLGDEKIPPQPIPYTAVDGTVQVAAGVGHDVAIVGVIPKKTIAGKGYGCNITVSTENHGAYVETYNVILHANETEIETKLVTVPIAGVVTVDFTWNTSSFAFGGYTIWAYAWPVPGETFTSDNNYTDGTVMVLWPGDIQTPFRKIDMKDIAYIAKRFLLPPSDPLWDPNADLNNDGKVDMKDIGTVAKYFYLTY